MSQCARTDLCGGAGQPASLPRPCFASPRGQSRGRAQVLWTPGASWSRFPSPLIEADLRISRIRLSGRLDPSSCRGRPSQVYPAQACHAQLAKHHLAAELPGAARGHLLPPPQKSSHSLTHCGRPPPGTPSAGSHEKSNPTSPPTPGSAGLAAPPSAPLLPDATARAPSTSTVPRSCSTQKPPNTNGHPCLKQFETMRPERPPFPVLIPLFGRRLEPSVDDV